MILACTLTAGLGACSQPKVDDALIRQYIQANAAIGMAFSQVQAGAFMAEMDKLQKSGGAQMAAVLKDPNVPEAVKVQIRTQQQKVQQTYAQNKAWADRVMGWVGKANDTETLAVVQRHRQALQTAFTAK
jgi:hypothetical protein